MDGIGAFMVEIINSQAFFCFAYSNFIFVLFGKMQWLLSLV
jgi:hypothetical protein